MTEAFTPERVATINNENSRIAVEQTVEKINNGLCMGGGDPAKGIRLMPGQYMLDPQNGLDHEVLMAAMARFMAAGWDVEIKTQNIGCHAHAYAELLFKEKPASSEGPASHLGGRCHDSCGTGADATLPAAHRGYPKP